MFKIAYRHSDIDYRVATLSTSYLTTTGITMQSLKSKDNMPKLTKKLSDLDRRTHPNHRKALLLKRTHIFFIGSFFRGSFSIKGCGNLHQNS